MNPTIIKGWDIPKETYVRAHEGGGLVKLAIDLSNVCNLSCQGCFTKRVDGGWNTKTKKRLPNEISYENQLRLLEEASSLGVKTIDIVGAGEPTLDSHFEEIIDNINGLGMYAVVFTHGVNQNIEELHGKDVSLFLKMWSRSPELQNSYVSGSLGNYSLHRDRSLDRLVNQGFNDGENINIDGIDYRTTRIGADILVMKSNYREISGLFAFCRENNIMPEIKTYIPEGPTRFDQIANIKVYSEEQLNQLRQDEISPIDFLKLRRDLIRLDKSKYGIGEMNVVYPQGSKCTQSMSSIYVTVTGDIRSCVGTHISYGTYVPNQNMLREVINERKEKVGFGCVPRIKDAEKRGIQID